MASAACLWAPCWTPATGGIHHKKSDAGGRGVGSVSGPAGRRVLILGGGPIGVEASLHAASLGYDVRLLERTRIGGHMLTWGHVRMFSPWGRCARPANDGRTNVWYTMVSCGPPGAPLQVEFIPVHYDHARFAAQMRAEALPEEFIQTILTGWWTTCLEILPAREHECGRF